jgi:hypothetical protein
MSDVTNDLLCEVLKSVRARLTNIEASFSEVRTELIAIRGHLAAMRADIAKTRLRRIEHRFDLADSPVT